MAVCTVCKSRIDDPMEGHREVCEACATRLGVVPMPAARRPPEPCLRCRNRSFVRAIPRELAHVDAGRTPRHAPMFVTYDVATMPKALGGERAGELEPYDGRGALEMYVCRRCGFVEWYCVDPDDLPIGPQYMTEIVEYEGHDQPYR